MDIKLMQHFGRIGSFMKTVVFSNSTATMESLVKVSFHPTPSHHHHHQKEGYRISFIYKDESRSQGAARPKAVFLNRRAAARYRALASIIPGREKFSWNLSF